MFGSGTWGGSIWAGPPGTGGSLPVIYLGQGILYPALRKAGITLGPQRGPSPAQYQDALEEVNRLIASLGTDRLFIYSRDIYTAPLTGVKTYTIGISADPTFTPDFPVPRPVWIESANVISNSTPPIRYKLAILDDLAWAKIRVQDIGNTIPWALYNDRAYPVSTLYLYAQPLSGYLLELYVWHQVPAFVTPEDVVLLPPGYEDAIVLNLAVRLGPHFQRNVDPDVRAEAQKALMRIESINAPQPILHLPCIGREGPTGTNDPWFTTVWGR